MPRGRPTAEDPKRQISIGIRASTYRRLEELAARAGLSVPKFVALQVESGNPTFPETVAAVPPVKPITKPPEPELIIKTRKHPQAQVKVEGTCIHPAWARLKAQGQSSCRSCGATGLD